MRIVFIVISFLFAITVNAANKESKKADQLFMEGNFQGAIEMYNLAIEKETDPIEKAICKYRIGEANFRLNRLDRAEKNLNDAIKQGYMNPEVYLLLGDVQLKLGKLDEAMSSFETYRLANPYDSNIQIKLASVKFARENQHNLSLFKLEPVPRINSKRNDFGVSYFNESLIFSSTRSSASAVEEEEEEEPVNKFADRTIPEKKNKTKAKSYTKDGLEQTVVMLAIGGVANSVNKYNRPMEITELNNLKDFPEDGVFVYAPVSQSLLYTHLDGKKAYINVMQLENNKWKKKEKIEVQSQGEYIGHPCMSPSGDRIYFTSKMPGGRGKSDIWYISSMGGGWGSTPINAGEMINTEGNEVFPYFSDGYFFFSSDGRIGMGGYDIYVSKVSSSGFEKPVNLGTPFNSSADDYNIAIKLDKSEGLLVSSRVQKNGDDIYMFEGFPSNLTVIGSVKDINTGAPISNVSLELFIEKKSLNKIVSDVNGDFVLPVIPNTIYRLVASVPGYASAEKVFASPNELYGRISKRKDVNLDFELYSNASVISGKVYDIQTLAPMEGAIVSLIAGGKVQQTVSVDPSGIYKFSNLTNNTDYTVRVDPKGYFFDTKSVRISGGSQRQEYSKATGHDMDFALQKFTINKEIIIPKVFFQEEKANILTESHEELDKLANMFIQNPHCSIILRGYVDIGIKREVANKLSLLRVNAVKSYLVSKNVNPAQISVNAMGYSNPLVRNPRTDDERRMNNRITYTVSRVDEVKQLEYLTPSGSFAGQTSTSSTSRNTSVTSTNTATSRQNTATEKSSQNTQSNIYQPQSTYQTGGSIQQQTAAGKSNSSESFQFIVQIASSGTLDLKDPKYAKVSQQLGYEVRSVLAEDGKYKYFVGYFETITEAKDVAKRLEGIGFSQPWARSRHK